MKYVSVDYELTYSSTQEKSSSQVGRLVIKKVSSACVQDKPGKRFTLNPFKLYLDSCATYHSAFVRNILLKLFDDDHLSNFHCHKKFIFQKVIIVMIANISTNLMG